MSLFANTVCMVSLKQLVFNPFYPIYNIKWSPLLNFFLAAVNPQTTIKFGARLVDILNPQQTIILGARLIDISSWEQQLAGVRHSDLRNLLQQKDLNTPKNSRYTEKHSANRN